MPVKESQLRQATSQAEQRILPRMARIAGNRPSPSKHCPYLTNPGIDGTSAILATLGFKESSEWSGMDEKILLMVTLSMHEVEQLSWKKTVKHIMDSPEARVAIRGNKGEVLEYINKIACGEMEENRKGSRHLQTVIEE
jgi:hypothetical protein